MKILTLGPAIVDMFMYTNEFISRGGDIRINKMDFGVGGSIINTVLILNKLGIASTYYTNLSDDQAGLYIRDTLSYHDIEVIYDTTNNTPICFILVDKAGERTMFSYTDNEFKINFDKLQRLHGDAFFMSCYEINDNNVDELVEFLKGFPNKTFLDLSPTTKDVPLHLWQKVLPHFSVLLGTKDEFEKLLSIIGLRTTGEIINLYGAQKIFVKMGKTGSMAITAQERQFSSSKPINVKNTTGCGDAFNAGVIIGELYGLPVLKTLAVSNELGGFVARSGITNLTRKGW